MRVKILYFAALREAVGIPEERCELPPGVDTPAALRTWLRARGGAWDAALADGRPIRAAIDQAMAAPDARFRDGAEVAFFPPVTGG